MLSNGLRVQVPLTYIREERRSLSVVEESTLGRSEEGTFREGPSEEALRRCVRKRVLLGAVGRGNRPR